VRRWLAIRALPKRVDEATRLAFARARATRQYVGAERKLVVLLEPLY
jgi:hypothetical protein